MGLYGCIVLVHFIDGNVVRVRRRLKDIILPATRFLDRGGGIFFDGCDERLELVRSGLPQAEITGDALNVDAKRVTWYSSLLRTPKRRELHERPR